MSAIHHQTKLQRFTQANHRRISSFSLEAHTGRACFTAPVCIHKSDDCYTQNKEDYHISAIYMCKHYTSVIILCSSATGVFVSYINQMCLYSCDLINIRVHFMNANVCLQLHAINFLYFIFYITFLHFLDSQQSLCITFCLKSYA